MKKIIIVFFAAALLFTIPAQAMDWAPPFTIINPYADVDWTAFGQYNAALHVHTNHSDGNATLADTVRHHYNLGFDVLAITDHNVLVYRWDEPAGLSLQHRITSFRRFFSRRESLTVQEKEAIHAGTYTGPFPAPFAELRRQQQNGMISLTNTNEQSHVSHINTFWATFNNTRRDTVESVLRQTQQLGGVAILNHPGRYTGGGRDGQQGAEASNNPAAIERYVNWFLEFDVALGMEIFNRLDRETRSERILWDNLLMRLMPYNRPIWGFSNDDSHSLNCVGYNWNVLLLPVLTEDNVRTAMETGAFYAVTRVARREGVNANQPDRASDDTLFLLEQPTPRITNITVGEDGWYITIAGENYDRIEWIVDGQVLHTGNTFSVLSYRGDIRHNYVRAQLVSETGIAMTQPFGIWAYGTYPDARPVVMTVDMFWISMMWWQFALIGAGLVVVATAGLIFIIMQRKKRK